jgi:teichuronic acid biosynthesis glycosyltransferase TuaH
MEFKEKAIFILGIAKFDGQFESTSFTTAKYLAQFNDVYYVDYPYTLKDYLVGKDASFKTRKPYFSLSSDGLIETSIPRLKILIVPPLLSLNFLPEGFFYRFLNKINEKIIVARIKKVLRRNNIKEFTFINSFNFHYPNVGPMLASNLSVYHCVDPLIVAYDQKHGLISEEQIIRQSDLVICTSKELYRQKLLLNKNTHFIPNAADLSLSSKALDPELKIHERLAGLKKPLIGYFGNIERRMDYPLLSKVIAMNPEKSFVFAGPVVEEYLPDNFKNPKNVHFIGQVPYLAMPSVIKGFDVAMIPFKKDEVSHTIFPLKLFEYLGAGKPVVATDFNMDLQDFTYDAVDYCPNADEFSKAIDRVLDQDNIERRQQRLNIASENTWEKRLLEFSGLIYKAYTK